MGFAVELPKQHRSEGFSSKSRWRLVKITGEETGFYFVDRDGNKLNGKIYSGASWFREGLAAVEDDGKWGFIDETGKYQISAKFVGARSFGSDGLAAAAIRNQEREKVWGFIDKRGEWVVAPAYEWAVGFSCGIGAVWKDKMWRYINRQGEAVFEDIEYAAGHAIDFDSGLARTFVDTEDAANILTYLDTSGKVVWQQRPVT